MCFIAFILLYNVDLKNAIQISIIKPVNEPHLTSPPHIWEGKKWENYLIWPTTIGQPLKFVNLV